VVDGHFATPEAVPRHALTMSIDLVFKARQVVLLASGARKTAAITRSVLEPPTAELPVSYCRRYAERGGDITYIVDEIAGSGLLAARAALKRRGIRLVDRRGKAC